MWHRVRHTLPGGPTSPGFFCFFSSLGILRCAGLVLAMFPLAAAETVRAEEVATPVRAPSAAPTKPAKAGAADPRVVLQSDKALVFFQQGRKLAAEKRYGEACEAFERSLSFESAIGTKFNLADCYEHIGRVASAQELFGEVALLAHSANEPEREKVARERAAALEPRIARLVVSPKVTPNDLELRRNGVLIARELWGKPLAVDPGFYDVDASGGGATWRQRVEVTGPGSTVWVLVPALGSETALATAVPPPPVARELKPTLPPAPSQETRSVLVWERAGPVVVGLSALGVAGLAAGTGFALKYKAKNDDAEAICQGSVCTADDIAEHDQLVQDARASRTGMMISFGVAGASFIGVAAAIWGPWWRQLERGPTAVKAAPVIGPNGTWGVSAEGSF